MLCNVPDGLFHLNHIYIYILKTYILLLLKYFQLNEFGAYKLTTEDRVYKR